MRFRRLLLLASLAIVLIASVFLLGGSDDVRGSVPAHVSSGTGCRRAIALTFDDGPDAAYTRRMLDALQGAGAKATFFVTGGNVAAHPDIVRRLRDNGMAIGLHSYAHAEGMEKASEDVFRADLERAAAAVEAALGERPRLYRAPFGKTSETMLRVLGGEGYVSIGWDVDPGDWRERLAESIAADVLAKAHPGAIVLLHDGALSGGYPDRTQTVEAVRLLIPELRRQGYELVTVPEIIDPAACLKDR